MPVIKKSFGFMPNGQEIFEYILANANGMSVSALNYGCTIRTIKVPDRNGVMGDVVLGFDTLEGYFNSPHYIGAVVGRYANRINQGEFMLDGKKYELSINMPPHHLHGGMYGFDKKVWEGKEVENEMGSGVTFQYVSPDGEEGFPGNLAVFVQYILTNENVLVINFIAYTDAPTHVNLIQHSYFNLTGRNVSSINHDLAIHADYFLPVDNTRMVTGEKAPVEDTLFDFREAKSIGSSFELSDPQINITFGLDHCWVLNKPLNELGLAATLFDSESGRFLEIHTSEPGIQVYTGFSLYGTGKDHIDFDAFGGVALETQHFPDSPNHPEFPSTLITPEKPYQSTTIFKFSALPLNPL